MGQFKAEKNTSGGVLTVSFSGDVDEDAVFSNLSLDGAKQVVLDLEGISAINSCGIREWIKWVKAAPADTKFVYRKCPKIIVDQINMVAGFLPDGSSVESFFVPYFNENSGKEKM